MVRYVWERQRSKGTQPQPQFGEPNLHSSAAVTCSFFVKSQNRWRETICHYPSQEFQWTRLQPRPSTPTVHLLNKDLPPGIFHAPLFAIMWVLGFPVLICAPKALLLMFPAASGGDGPCVAVLVFPPIPLIKREPHRVMCQGGGRWALRPGRRRRVAFRSHRFALAK